MSIILGLGIRELLVGGRSAAVSKARADLTTLPFLAAALVLIAIVQFWWYLFIVANRGVWSGNFFLFAGTLLRPTLLFLSAASVFPNPGSREDVAAHYFDNRAFIYLPLAIYELQNLVESAVNLGTINHPAHLFHLLFTGGAICLAVSANRTLHLWLVPILLLASTVFIAAFSLRLD